MNISQIENNLQKLINTLSRDTFIYELLLAYGQPKASITRLKKGSLNLSKNDGEVSWKKKVYYREEYDEDLHLTVSELADEIKHNQRFVIVTDYKTLLAIDTKTDDKLDIKLKDLPNHYDFFLPWAGMEKAQHQNENPADVKAAEKMAKLFDEIKRDNPNDSPEFIHGLNVFLCRLLFCLFAEDTNIFKENQFISSISSHTQQDGSDLSEYLDKLFDVLNIPKSKRNKLPAYLNDFPYVNGGLFANKINAPKLKRRSRQAIISAGELDWSEINPDIFGSMIQAVVSPEDRGGLGLHYTSVPNIMKVIKPLFLDSLYEELEKAGKNKKKLAVLLDRIHKIKIFDPACGSGNFLIIAYKELRRLEMEIFKAGSMINLPGISLSQFYGIEIDDFAHEITMLSLWLAEHQMNVVFFKEFGKTNPTLPLKSTGNIALGNAIRLNWSTVCKNNESDEIYILGNPPYIGGKSQSKEQKEDMNYAFSGVKNFKELDYIACWFILASKFINKKSRFAFVATSSINQGAQVAQLWPLINNVGQEIYFAYAPFKWTNYAKGNAGVAVSIIGVQHNSNGDKVIFFDNQRHKVDNINAYLLPGKDLIIAQRLSPLSELPAMITGNSPYENNHLRFDTDVKNMLADRYPESKQMLKKVIGANEFLKDIDKWCVWITDEMLKTANRIPPIKERINKTKQFRLSGGEVARGIANRPHQFRYTHTAMSSQIIIPIVSSERREYLPIGYLGNDSIIISSAAAIYDPEPHIFGILSSQMHYCWVRITAGRLENRLRYLSALCWNTFPFPEASESKIEHITQSSLRILEEREKYPEKTIAQLYDPDTMPNGLKEAHKLNDSAVDSCYRSKPFDGNEERLEYLFKLYENMLYKENDNGPLFINPKKPKKKRKNNKCLTS
jgi:hypothetical protein